MEEIEPPVTVEKEKTEESKRYILTVATQPDFDYPQVR